VDVSGDVEALLRKRPIVGWGEYVLGMKVGEWKTSNRDGTLKN